MDRGRERKGRRVGCKERERLVGGKGGGMGEKRLCWREEERKEEKRVG